MLSNTCKYALRALIYLAKNSTEKEKVGIKKIAVDLNISSTFLGKILQRLARENILASTKGPHGGFCLSVNPTDLSVYRIIQIIDGEKYFETCLIGMGPCHQDGTDSAQCPVHDRFVQFHGEMSQLFKETSLKQIIEDAEKKKGLIRY